MEKSIFRKSSLERISSPEQLNEYVKVTNPGIWLVLLGLFILLFAVGIWAFTGSIPETVQLAGVAYGGEEQETDTIYCYVPLSVSKRLNTEMKAQVSPDYAPREEYGYIFGSVLSIGDKPVSEEELCAVFGGVQYVQEILPQGNAVEVQIALTGTDGKLKWSNQKGESISVTDGSYCNVLIVTKERRPYELVFK